MPKYVYVQMVSHGLTPLFISMAECNQHTKRLDSVAFSISGAKIVSDSSEWKGSTAVDWITEISPDQPIQCTHNRPPPHICSTSNHNMTDLHSKRDRLDFGPI